MENKRVASNSIIPRGMAVSLAAAALALILSVFAAPAGAGAAPEQRTHWATLRVHGTAAIQLGENHVEGWNDCGSGWLDYLSFSSTIDTRTVGGVLGGFEYVFARRYGVEVDFLYWSEVVGIHFEAGDLTVDGSPTFIMPTLGANYHFLVDDKKDVYAGGMLGLGVIATGFYTDIDVSKDFALGLNLGMDWFLSERWCLGGTVKYVDFGELAFSVLPPGMSGLVCDNGLFGIGHMNYVSLNLGLGLRF